MQLSLLIKENKIQSILYDFLFARRGITSMVVQQIRGVHRLTNAPE